MFRVLERWLHRGLLAVLCASGVAAGLPAAAAQNLSETLTEAAGVPQVPAFLPDRYSEAKTTPLPIDGLWLINTIRKKIRIEAGRAFAVDGWLHLFVLNVQPDMVVMRNVQRTGAGQYRADDLPLMGPATMQLDADGNLAVSVQGALGPARYQLRRLEPQYPEALQAELAAAGHQAAPPVAAPVTPPSAPAEPLPGMPPVAPPTEPVAPAPTPVPQPVPQPAPYPTPAPTPAPPADCKPIGIDPDSGATICA